MIHFRHTIADELGLHARPAGQLVKLATKYASEITLSCNGKTANAKRLLGVMALGTKGGYVLDVTISGPDEQQAHDELAAFLAEQV